MSLHEGHCRNGQMDRLFVSSLHKDMDSSISGERLQDHWSSGLALNMKKKSVKTFFAQFCSKH